MKADCSGCRPICSEDAALLLERPPGPCTVLINAGDGIDTVRHPAQLPHGVGGHGDDYRNLTIQDIEASATPLRLNLDGGIGTDSATVSSDIDASVWTM